MNKAQKNTASGQAFRKGGKNANHNLHPYYNI